MYEDDVYNTGVGTRLLTYDISVPREVSNRVRSFKYKDKEALRCVIVNLLSCVSRNNTLVYSRNKWEKSLSKKKITVHRVINAVQWLEKEGYATNLVGVGNKIKEYRIPSLLIPTDKLKDIFMEKEKVLSEEAYLDSAQVIELRDKDKTPIPFNKTEGVKRMEKGVRLLNRLLYFTEIVSGEGEYLTNMYCRIFNESFDWGGRWYRADILSLNNKDDNARLDITLDDDPVVEVDYSALHLRLASIILGINPDDLGVGDAYSNIVEGCSDVDRNIIKLSINILFNCSSRRQASGAIRKLIDGLTNKEKERYNLGSAKEVVDMLYRELPQFTSLFCKEDGGIGGELQNMDSSLVAEVVELFVKHKIPILPVHDSFIVPKQCEQILVDTMTDAFYNLWGVDCSVPLTVKRKENGRIYKYIAV